MVKNTQKLGYWYNNDYVIPEEYEEDNKFVNYIEYNGQEINVGIAYPGNFFNPENNEIIKNQTIYTEKDSSGNTKHYITKLLDGDNPEIKKIYLEELKYTRYYNLETNILIDSPIESFELKSHIQKVPFVYAPKPSVEPKTSWEYILGSVENIRKQLSLPVYVKKNKTGLYYDLTSMAVLYDIDDTFDRKQIYYREIGEDKCEYYISDLDGSNSAKVDFEKGVVKYGGEIITHTIFIPSMSYDEKGLKVKDWPQKLFYYPYITTSYPIYIDEIPENSWIYDSGNVNNPEALTTVYTKDLYMPCITDDDVIQNEYVIFFNKDNEKLISWKDKYYPTLNIFYSDYRTNTSSYNEILSDELATGKYYTGQKFRFQEVFCQPKYNGKLKNESIHFSSGMLRNWFASGTTDGTMKTLVITTRPVDANIIITAEGYEQKDNAITVPYGTIVHYKVELDGFETVENDYKVTLNENIYIDLTAKVYSWSIDSIPDNAKITVYINDNIVASGIGKQTGVAKARDEFRYIIEKEGYNDSIKDIIVSDEIDLVVSLVPRKYMLDIIPTPSNANVVLTADGYVQSGNSILVDYQTEVSYTISSYGYLTTTGSIVMVKDKDLSISLEEKLYKVNINSTPSDANVSIIYKGKEYKTNTLMVQEGQEITINITRDGYNSISLKELITESKTFDIQMEKKFYKYEIQPIPSDATVKLTADGYTQSGNSITVPYGTEVSYSVSREGYLTKVGTYKVLNTITQQIELVEQMFNLTINPTPSDAIVKLTATGYTQSGNSITVPYGTTVGILVSKTGYVSKSQQYTVLKDSSVSISLSKQMYILRISPNPSDATVKLTATGYTQSGNSITVPYGTEVSYSVSAPNYDTISAKKLVLKSEILYISLDLSTFSLTINPTPSDAIVKLTATGYTQSGNSITVPYGTEVSYYVSKDRYEPQSEETVVVKDTTLNIKLVPGILVDLSDYEYTVDENNVVVLTKYIGTKTNIVTPRVDYWR